MHNESTSAPDDFGILLAAYGSRHKRSRDSIRRVEAAVAARFPGVPVRWAFTSKNIRRLADDADSTAEALAKFAAEGLRRVAVQSLHIIAGAEYEEMLAAVDEARDDFDALTVGGPLLHSAEDIDAVADALLREAVPHDRPADQAVIILGHGADHPANAAYESLALRLRAKDPGVHLGLLEHGQGPLPLRDALQATGTTKAHLIPLLFTAGMHAHHDVVGDDEGSWQSVLEAGGIEVTATIRGAAEYEGVLGVWMGHLDMCKI